MWSPPSSAGWTPSHRPRCLCGVKAIAKVDDHTCELTTGGPNPLKDVRVRRAISQALDVKLLNIEQHPTKFIDTGIAERRAPREVR
jgi:hypothetical protein